MLNTLTKAKLSEQLNKELGLTKRESKELVESFLDEIKQSLEKGNAVKISGFGNFNLLHKKERPGRNPKTGESIPVSKRTVVTFKSSQKFRAMLDRKLIGKR